MHPLDGAYERVYGAREHLDALKPIFHDFAKVVEDGISLKYERGTREVNGQLREVPIGTASSIGNYPIPPKAGRLISDAIQNLRIALDYLIYELACFDAKRIVEKTQFVIVDCEKDFRRNLWHLNGLSVEHIAMFEWLQPYKGCHWTGFLRDLSNPDKHQHFSTVKHPVTIRIDDANTKAILAGKHVDVNSYASFDISFVDGPPVIEGIEQLCFMVAQTLDAFKPEFQ